MSRRERSTGMSAAVTVLSQPGAVEIRLDPLSCGPARVWLWLAAAVRSAYLDASNVCACSLWWRVYNRSDQLQRRHRPVSWPKSSGRAR
jgi:hypothetical protein